MIGYYNYFRENQNSSLPFAIEFDSGIPGPHLMFVGSTHGHEPAGTVANVEIHKQFVSGKLKLQKGRVTFVLGNPVAFLDNKRFVDKNLNRAFLDDLEDHIEGQRAVEFRRYFDIQKVDYLFDLHSVSVGDYRFVVYFDNPQMHLAAINLSPIETHMVVNQQTVPGSLMQEAARYGALGIVFECGNNSDPKTVEIAKYHIISSMIYYGMVDVKDIDLPDIRPLPEICIYKVEDIIKPGPQFKFVNPNITTGSFVKQGEIYVTYENTNAIAEQDYYIVMPDKNPSIYDNDAGFLCSKSIVFRD